MRIGILTFQRAHNYGAILQCFALQEILMELGCDVEVIDYCPPSMDFYKYFKWSCFRPWHPSSSFINLLSIKHKKKRYDAFNDFIESHLKLSSRDTIESLSEKYDLVIVESDQVWNPQNSMVQYDDYYWGNFKKGDKPKLITYAVSMGGAWKKADWSKIKDFLANFDAISVREGICYYRQIRMDLLSCYTIVRNNNWRRGDSCIRSSCYKRCFSLHYCWRNISKSYREKRETKLGIWLL